MTSTYFHNYKNLFNKTYILLPTSTNASYIYKQHIIFFRSPIMLITSQSSDETNNNNLE